MEIRCDHCKSMVIQDPESVTLVLCKCRRVGVDNDGRVLGDNYTILFDPYGKDK